MLARGKTGRPSDRPVIAKLISNTYSRTNPSMYHDTIAARLSGQLPSLLKQLPGHRLVDTSTAQHITVTVDIFVEHIPKDLGHRLIWVYQKILCINAVDRT